MLHTPCSLSAVIDRAWLLAAGLGLASLAGCGGQDTGASPMLPMDPVEQMMTPPGACLPIVSCTGEPPGLSKQSWKHSTRLAGACFW
jgi:hypothetical protein